MPDVQRSVDDGGACCRYHQVRLDDGRVLEVLTAGDPAGLAVVFHHGTPFAAVPYQPMLDTVQKVGVHLVGWSRPGYGTSTRQRDRTVAAVADDARHVLDSLGHEQFATVGWSGGGPHALATAAGLPGRCLGAATIGGVAPYRAEGLDWLAGMGPENVAEFTAAVGPEDALTSFLEQEAGSLRTVSAPEVAQALGGLVSDVDRQALTGTFADYMARALRAALAPGVGGWYDDDKAFVSDWGFDLSSLACRVAVWQGGEDRMVPFAHGSWLVDHLPRVEAHLLPEEGHLSLVVTGFERILEDLVARTA